VTTPDEGPSVAGTAQPGNEHDPEVAEAYAESVSIDPSHDEINEYLKIAGGTPLDEQLNTPPTDKPGA
jgi:hypothetical protein